MVIFHTHVELPEDISNINRISNFDFEYDRWETCIQWA